MGWLQIDFNADPESAPALESLLELHGAVSVTMSDAEDQPLFEPGPGETPLWQSIILSGLFTENTQAESLVMNLASDYLPDPLPDYSINFIEEQDWQRAWIDRFKPMQFGEHLWICPSWCEIPDPDGVNLLLDPGLAFGTGTHPTTRLCLEWLDNHELKNKNLIDFGCGSGILGIAAILLGATHVIGVDNDPQALLASRKNSDNNNIHENQFSLFLPEQFEADQFLTEPSSFNQVDGLLANILAEPLISLAELFSQLILPNGFIVLSGILENQAKQVIAAYTPWFTFVPPVCKDGWVRLEATRK